VALAKSFVWRACFSRSTREGEELTVFRGVEGKQGIDCCFALREINVLQLYQQNSGKRFELDGVILGGDISSDKPDDWMPRAKSKRGKIIENRPRPCCGGNKHKNSRRGPI